MVEKENPETGEGKDTKMAAPRERSILARASRNRKSPVLIVEPGQPASNEYFGQSASSPLRYRRLPDMVFIRDASYTSDGRPLIVVQIYRSTSYILFL